MLQKSIVIPNRVVRRRLLQYAQGTLFEDFPDERKPDLEGLKAVHGYDTARALGRLKYALRKKSMRRRMLSIRLYERMKIRVVSHSISMLIEPIVLLVGQRESTCIVGRGLYADYGTEISISSRVAGRRSASVGQPVPRSTSECRLPGWAKTAAPWILLKSQRPV